LQNRTRQLRRLHQYLLQQLRKQHAITVNKLMFGLKFRKANLLTRSRNRVRAVALSEHHAFHGAIAARNAAQAAAASKLRSLELHES
jgi:hypothetical protein